MAITEYSLSAKITIDFIAERRFFQSYNNTVFEETSSKGQNE